MPDRATPPEIPGLISPILAARINASLDRRPHLGEAYRTTELLFPAIGTDSPLFQTVEKAVESATASAGSATFGLFSSI